eukprot:gb/GECG01011761.1/.p1 GENE.gb/GECG01011761.1/~~gb/GECG01011761.1/.p1  ORF type:complete len:223 (+),score=52.61 gb/GECG01011761.1/:1-669(+)
MSSTQVPLREVNDEEAILNFIFDPNKSFIGATMPWEENQEQNQGSLHTDKEPQPEEPEHIKKCKELEKKAVEAAEAADSDKALELLAEAEKVAPERGSVLNNRAQVLRLQKKYDEALTQLNKAIQMETEWMENNKDRSHSREYSSHKHVLQQAHTQRAAVHQAKGNKEDEHTDLEAAAAYGSTIARMATTETNPYATLCHKAVEQMMQDAFSGNEEAQNASS